MDTQHAKKLVSWLVILSIVLTSIPLLDTEAFAARRTGGRAGGKSGFSRSSPSSQPSAPGDYSRSRDYGRDYTRDRDTTTYVPVPFGGGGPFWYSSPRYYPGWGVGGGMGSLLFWALIVGALVFVGVLLFSRMSQMKYRASPGGAEPASKGLAAAHIIKFQLALLSAARELQEELNKLAETADTDDPTGLQLLLQETTLALIRHPEYWMQAEVKGLSTPSYEAAESKFDELVMAERAKFSEETLSNVEGRVRKRESKQNGEAVEVSDYIVVTLIVATTRTTLQPLPAIQTEDLQKFLTALGSLSAQELLAVEVLWTPQNTTDVLTEEDLLVGYPELKQVL